MITNQDWLPVGTVVGLEGSDQLMMISGYMAIKAETGQLCDYVGYPYPEGHQASTDYLFDKSDITEIKQLGYLNSTGCAFQAYLEDRTLEYEMNKEKRS